MKPLRNQKFFTLIERRKRIRVLLIGVAFFSSCTTGASELAAVCSFDPSVPKISCQASGYTDGRALRWESNVSGWNSGPSFEIWLVKSHQLVPEVVVTLRKCPGPTCETVKTLIDTSILAPGKSVAGRGFAELVDVADGLAGWLSQETVLYAISVSDPLVPSIMGVVDAPEHASAAFQDKEYLYVGGSHGLSILRADDPFGEPLGTFRSRVRPTTIVTEGGYAYLTSGTNLVVLDVSDPSEPTEASRLKLSGRAPVNVQLQAGLAYIPATLGGLNVVDVTDPRNPLLIAVIPFESHSLGFKIRGSYGYLGRTVSVTPTEQWYEASSVFEVVDFSVPDSPRTVGSISIPTMIQDLDLFGNYAYVTGAQITGPNHITVIDISSPANPRAIEFPNIGRLGSNNFHDIYIDNGYAYILDGGRGMRVLDIRDPLRPTLVATLEMPQANYCMHGAGKVIYLCAEEIYLNVADVSDPDSPVLTSSVAVPGGLSSQIVLKDRKAFFSGGGLNVYDLTDPKAPKKLPIENYGVDTIALHGDFLYSTVGEWGLDVWDLSDIENQVFLSRTNFPIGMPHDMSHDGKWVVGIANKPYSITLIDVSDPFQPLVMDSYVFDDYADTVTVKDDHVYLPRGPDGVDIFEISGDGLLTLIANYPASSSSNYVEVSGNRAYVLGGIDVLDITDPGQPTLIRQLPSNGIPHRAKVHEGYLYLADGSAGLTVVPLKPIKEAESE